MNASKHSGLGFVRVLATRRMIVALIMGFASGLPLLLTISLLQAWMKEAGVDLTYIGLMALVGLPYTLKFVWAPVLDRYTPPFLGRRRGWLLIIQVLLMGSIAWLGLSDPAASPVMLVVAALLVTFFSASQDIVIDAYRREDLPRAELGLGSSLYVYGYRLGMLLAGGGGLILADHVSYATVYLIMAGIMGLGALTTLATIEPEADKGQPATLREAVFEPFIEYFQRSGAVWILTFILLYKLGDNMAAQMTTPFYLDMGYTKTDIGAVVKIFGFWATIIGTFIGGVILLRFKILAGLWAFGIMQAVSTALFALLTLTGPSLAALSLVIGFENLSSGMGTAAFVAFMASLTNKKFTATQYALLTSLMGVPRVLASAPTGFMAQNMGWAAFFIACALIALPGLLLLVRFGGLIQQSQDAAE